ncbi:hypothetical protein BDW22DRAFT_1418218 [Trametopsis cervina]|nr:hypothetical protein BDW22DRAFT_1418218 [Trametopsis cervina]
MNLMIPDGLSECEINLKTDDKVRLTKKEHTTELITEKITVWKRGTYPPPDSNILKIPFSFKLPVILPASCKHRAVDATKKQEVLGEVGYYLELVGARSGIHSKRRERTSFRVLPPTVRGAKLQDSLTPGWSGAWRTVARHINAPVGNTKRTSRVDMKFVVPSIESIPSSVDIPYTLTITATSPRIDLAQTTDYTFVEPPSRPQAIEFKLERVLRVQLNPQHHPAANITNCLLRLGGLGPGLAVANGGPVETHAGDKVWVPEYHDPSRGSWRQETKFTSRFRLICPPTLVTELLRVEYRLYLKINLVGEKQAIECEIPINVIAGPVSSTPSTPTVAETAPRLDSPSDTLPAYFDIHPHLNRSIRRPLPNAFPHTDEQIMTAYRNTVLNPAWL